MIYHQNYLDMKLTAKNLSKKCKSCKKFGQKNNYVIPTSWACSRLEALWKNKGSRLEASNYRGLSIGSVLCKICINIILERLKMWYSAQLCHQQHGFRPGEGTADAIYISKRIHHIYSRRNHNYSCFWWIYLLRLITLCATGCGR